MQALRYLWPLFILLLAINCECQRRPRRRQHGQSARKAGGILGKEKLGKLTPGEYKSWRESYMQTEESKTVGSDLKLSQDEVKANQIIMSAKKAEYDEGLKSPRLFAPAKHFFDVLDKIKKSRLFKIISEMPKGGVLHAHDTALCSTKFVLELTYREHLWVCIQASEKFAISSLKFSKEAPPALDGCKWELLADVRKSKGSDKVDEYLSDRLTLYPQTSYSDNDAVWEDFFTIFGLLDGLLFYAPVWADYYYNALEEFYKDGVQYLEFRTTLPTLYDLKGTKFTPVDTVRIYHETLTQFKKKYPDFIDSKLIYAPLRFADEETFKTVYIKTLNEIRKKYPKFVIGFDLVGQEERGRPLLDYAQELLSMPEDINFYFHAGETNWYGSKVDENLIDAILLGTKRIGHGFAVVKHPMVLQMIKEKGIAVELCPISNQVLQLVRDLRNHPGAILLSDNYPVVISSDDPSFWKAKPLSHDFYAAFLGIASAHADLRLLKKLAMNSITYSGMDASEKKAAMSKWQKKWNEFIRKTNKPRSRNAAQGRLDMNDLF